MKLRWLRWLGIRASLIFLLLAVFLACCQSKLIYMPRSYGDQMIKIVNARPLRFATSQGTQTAWLRPKYQRSPERVCLVFAGNGTLALELSSYFFGEQALDNDLFVLVDYPGYGQSAGSPSPSHIRESIQALMPELAKELNLAADELRGKTYVMGHSLGCAAALMAMHEHRLKHGVLIAPFSTMMSMAKRRVGWPLCLVLHHRFDNVSELAAVDQVGGHVQIIHGTDDEVIPQAEGLALAASHPRAATFSSADKGRHNDILTTHREVIMQALRDARD